MAENIPKYSIIIYVDKELDYDYKNLEQVSYVSNELI